MVKSLAFLSAIWLKILAFLSAIWLKSTKRLASKQNIIVFLLFFLQILFQNFNINDL